jgi:MoaA/NifB/PqqE/SkfB family radical SAM enzyme
MVMIRGLKTLSIHLTDLCNSRCIFCVVGIPDRDSDSVVPADVRRVLVDNRGRGFEAVNLHGGEPTVHPAFLQTLELIRECGYPEVHLQTNGIKLADRELVDKLRELQVTLFIVSVHGRDAKTHDGLTRHRGGFVRTVEGIRNAKATGGRVRTNTVVTLQNLQQLPVMVDWLLDLGVDQINISNLHPVETAYRHFDLVAPTVAEMREVVPAAVARARERGSAVTLEGFPMCALPGLESLHLSRHGGRISMEIRGLWLEDYDRFMDEVCRVKGEPCSRCARDEACGGVYREYVEKRGWSEFEAIAVAVH